MSNNVTLLGDTCIACNKLRRKKSISYHPDTFLPYCANPYQCTNDHPNSIPNITKRAVQTGDPDLAKVEMLPFHVAEQKFPAWLAVHKPTEESQRLARMTTRPVTFRIGNYETAEFLLRYQDALGVKSVSDVVRYCIESVMDEFETGKREMPVKPIPPEEDPNNETRYEQSDTTEDREDALNEQDDWSF